MTDLTNTRTDFTGIAEGTATTIDILVLRPGSSLARMILPASAIVGSVAGDGRYVIDFEGNLTGMDNMRTYAQRLLHAAGRHSTRYPTIARESLSFDEAIRQTAVVGHYDATRFVVQRVTDPDALSVWAGESIDAIAGIRLAPGPLDLNHCEAALEGSSTILGTASSALVKTLSGQAVWFEGPTQATVYDHDDREFRMMMHDRLPDQCARLLFGGHPIFGNRRG